MTFLKVVGANNRLHVFRAETITAVKAMTCAWPPSDSSWLFVASPSPPPAPSSQGSGSCHDMLVFLSQNHT